MLLCPNKYHARIKRIKKRNPVRDRVFYYSEIIWCSALRILSQRISKVLPSWCSVKSNDAAKGITSLSMSNSVEVRRIVNWSVNFMILFYTEKQGRECDPVPEIQVTLGGWIFYVIGRLVSLISNNSYVIMSCMSGSRSSFNLSLIHIWRCRRSTLCRSRWSPYH